MKHLIRTLIISAVAAAAPFAATEQAAAQNATGDNALINGTGIVDGCRPLLAPDCVVDDMITEVAVGSSTADYTAVLDANIDNSATIISLVNVGVASHPIISIRDLKHKYSGGQQVGFVIGSESELLGLNVIENFTITLFNDNEMVCDPIVVDAEAFKLLSLDLLSGKGRNTLLVDVPENDDEGKDIVFDEIMLSANGIGVNAVSLGTQVYYGFVGNSEEKLKNPAGKDNTVYISKHRELLVDQNNFANDGGSYTPFDGVSLGGIANFGFSLSVKYVNGYAPDDVEVGFVYKNSSLADVDLLKQIKIKVQEVKTTTGILGEKEEVVNEDEYDVSSSLASVSVLSSNDKASYSVRVSGLDFNWNKVILDVSQLEVLGLLGETTFEYAYIKEYKIPEEAEMCPLDLCADELICDDETTYTLKSDFPVKWELTSGQNGVTIENADNKEYATSAVVTFADNNKGVYRFEATDEHGCTGTVTITRGKTVEMVDAAANAFCGIPLDAKLDNVELTKKSEGGLLVIDGLENADKIIDGDLGSYASYARGVQVAANTCIVSVKKTDGKFDDAKVVGFVAETPMGLLGADVLTFYRIELYNNGTKVYDKVAGENDGVGVSLVGAASSGMVRYAIEVPGDVAEFDEFALYTSGVLNLDLQGKTMKIYNAFVSNDANCAAAPAGSPLGHAGVTPINLATTGAQINYSKTGGDEVNLVNAFSSITQLGYLIENDVTNLADADGGALFNTVAGVLAPSRLAVKTGRVFSGNRWVGIVMRKPTGLADVEVLDLGMTISTYCEGIQQDEAGTDVSLVRANLLGNGDYIYLSVYAKMPFDEVRFTKNELVSALSTTEYLGFYTYADADGDGIPDAEDPDFCDTPIDVEIGSVDTEVDINSLCEGRENEGLTVKVTTSEGYDGAQLFYSITDTDRDENKLSGGISSSPLIIDFKGSGLGYGRYALSVSDRANPLLSPVRKTFTIHAVQTTWNPQSVLVDNDAQAEGGEEPAGTYVYSTDWNEWKNWTRGVPVIGCTDVVIPSDSKSYPILGVYNDETGTKPTDFNSCDTIHFMHGGEVLGTELLDYKYASVDLELASGRYYMLSTPLKATYAGDFFVPAGMNGSQGNDLFVKLDEETSPENRFSPRVYQRLWMQSAPVVDKVESGNSGDVTGQTTPVNYDETRWTPPFNGLTQEYGVEIPAGAYSLGEDASIELYNPAGDDHTSYTPGGFSLMADAEDLAVTTLKFRLPKEHTKYYYYNEKNQKTDLYETISRGGDAGRLITDDLNNKEDWSFNVNITLNDESDYFLVGNPFMAHINIAKFLEGNNGITEVKVYDGNALNSAILCDGEGLLTNNNTDKKDWTSIAPMQSFLFFVKKADATEQCSVTFSRDMLETKPEDAQPLRVSQSRTAETDADRIVIKARVGDVESSAVVRFSAGASAGFVPGEDASLLVDNEVRPCVQVFTLAGDRAADIQQTPDVDRLTLGLMADGGEPLTLSLDGDTGWTLYDTQTGATYQMDGGAEADLGTVGSSTGRYMLVRDITTIGDGLVPARGITVSRTPQGTITVASADGTALAACAVYSTDGTLTDRADGDSDRYELRAAQGVSIVTVTKADGTSYTQKIY